MNTLLVPFDFSIYAENALNYAVGLAQNTEASITLFHAFEVPVPAGYEDASLTYNMALANEEKKKLKLRLEEVAAAYKDSVYIGTTKPVEFQVEVKRDDFEEAIADFLKLHPHNLVIMGTKGMQGWEELVDESNTAIISEVINTSVLVVPVQASFEGIQHTVYGSNLDKKDSLVLNDLRDFSEFFGGRITCVHVRVKPDVKDKDWQSVEQLEHIFENTDNVTFQVIASPSAEQGLFSFAKSNNADLLAVKPQDHGLIGSLFHKSVTKQLAHHTDMPLLIVKK